MHLWKACCKVLPVPEYKFHPDRRWRFDWAWPDQRIMIACEQEGGIWTRGRHTRGMGYLNDMDKYNEAAKLGWRIFRFTPQAFKKGIAQIYMSEIVNPLAEARQRLSALMEQPPLPSPSRPLYQQSL